MTNEEAMTTALWAANHEDDTIRYLGEWMLFWLQSDLPAKLPDGLQVKTMAHLMVLRFGNHPPGQQARHPHPLPRDPRPGS